MIDSSDSMDGNQRNRKSWNQHEDSVLTRLVKKYGVKRWTDISKAMSDLFDMNNKSGKQCRQRWVNHLDPKINREKWTIEEERKIFQGHKIYGNKWKIIAKQLDNRTDNSIKNHFYSILRKGLRRVNKLIGDRKSTQKVKQIRTSVLSKLYKLQQSSQKSQTTIKISDIYQLLFQFSSMNSTNISQKNLTENIKNDFKFMISHLQEMSSQEKINKEKNVAFNKSKKQRKMSFNSMMNEEQEENDDDGLLIQNELFSSHNNEKKQQFMINVDIPQRSSKQACLLITSQQRGMKLIHEQKTSQKEISQSFLFIPSLSQPKLQINLKQEQESQLHEKSEDFNPFPSITINLQQQSLSIGQSNHDFAFNNCFSKSPLFSSSRMGDHHFNLRTPRVFSPGAFNFCGVVSTAQSYVNASSFGSKDGNQGKSMSFDNELDNIVEQLKSNINSNCNIGSLVEIRVSSSRNSLIEPCLRNSSSSIFLTPRSGEGKAH